ncbi:MAG TPA: hypothetical protein VJC09_02290 [Candidatus Saccharimonadales bacterium]|nr:hypothetical protein [Candidatus Saccharimonadales bacterium]
MSDEIIPGVHDPEFPPASHALRDTAVSLGAGALGYYCAKTGVETNNEWAMMPPATFCGIVALKFAIPAGDALGDLLGRRISNWLER